jgi:hypothetical protein
MMPLNVPSDLESDLIGSLFGYYLDQINEKPNKNVTFLDLVDMAVGGAETPLLKLNRHHKAYEIEMQICFCNFEAMEGDRAAIVEKLDAFD